MKGGDVRGVETIMVTGLPFVESVAGLNKFLKIKAAKRAFVRRDRIQNSITNYGN